MSQKKLEIYNFGLSGPVNEQFLRAFARFRKLEGNICLKKKSENAKFIVRLTQIVQVTKIIAHFEDLDNRGNRTLTIRVNSTQFFGIITMFSPNFFRHQFLLEPILFCWCAICILLVNSVRRMNVKHEWFFYTPHTWKSSFKFIFPGIFLKNFKKYRLCRPPAISHGGEFLPPGEGAEGRLRCSVFPSAGSFFVFFSHPIVSPSNCLFLCFYSVLGKVTA